METMFDYFHPRETEHYLFLQMPLMLFKDEKFKKLSDSAKILYSLLLNRTSLSAKNGWVDENNNVYIIYTIKEIGEDLNCWEQKAQKALKELKDIGLVKSIRRGLNKPNLIYVMNFATELKYQVKEKEEPESQTEPLKNENQNSGNVKNTIPKKLKSPASKIDLIKINQNKINLTENVTQTENLSQKNQINQENFTTVGEKSKSSHGKSQNFDMPNNIEPDFSDILDIDTDFDFINSYNSDNSDNSDFSEPIIEPKSQNVSSPKHSNTVNNYNPPEYDYNTCKNIIKKNIYYDKYMNDFYGQPNPDIQLIDELINCMLDVIFSNGNYVKIGGELKNRNLVVSYYLSISSFDIDLIISKYKEQSHKITHLNSYLKTMLYNVKQENVHFYTNDVRVDNPHLFI